jgi:hypothetical protein
LYIPDPDLDVLPIPDPGVKKAPDPESVCATLLFSLQIGLPPVTTAITLVFFSCSYSMMDSNKNWFSWGFCRLGTPRARLTLLDFLLSELMAAQMAAGRQPKDAAMNIRIQV